MARLIAWRVVFETDKERGRFPIAISTDKISDEIIRHYLKECVEEFNIDYSADDIYHLLFIATDDDTEKSYLEPLSPFDFWPHLPEGIDSENRHLFRE